ncbi:hypothetical protein AFK24_21190 [Pseudomonas syringae]|uniref:Uncharacterized protein n=1 Tax=Pseudomonas syringae TaxID=317 RepID=A0A1C7Z4E4_PSESX|nr:hypothetical protein AFK24_21190 [Pseudomonas syringae]
MLPDIVFAYTIEDFLASLTSYCHATDYAYLFMAVSGTGTLGVNIQPFLKPELIFGKKNSMTLSSGTKKM